MALLYYPKLRIEPRHDRHVAPDLLEAGLLDAVVEDVAPHVAHRESAAAVDILCRLCLLMISYLKTPPATSPRTPMTWLGLGFPCC